MQIGFIGLGRMGSNMVLNLLDHEIKVAAYNRSPKPIEEIAKKGAIPAYTIMELASKLPKRKIVWIMVTSSSVDYILEDLLPLLNKGDIIIDGGNSFYKDSIRRHNKLRSRGIYFLDVGTSGGVEGARHGACLMVGGETEAFREAEYIFKALAKKDGYKYVGQSGSGHFVKMVHNGIEYGMMAAISEGFEAIYKHKKDFSLDLKTIAEVYSNGSIISSSLINWLKNVLNKDPELSSIKGTVPLGETEKEMNYLKGISEMPVLSQAIKEREKSRKKQNFRSKVVAALRNEFGEHKLIE